MAMGKTQNKKNWSEKWKIDKYVFYEMLSKIRIKS